MRISCDDAPAERLRLVSGCDSPPWMELLATLPRHAHQTPLMLNVGANKGYLVPEYLSLFAQKTPSVSEWHAEIARYALLHGLHELKHFSWGMCAQQMRTAVRASERAPPVIRRRGEGG